MTSPEPKEPISPLRARMLDDMRVRNFADATQRDYTRAVKTLAAFLGRSPDTATAEELRAFQKHLAMGVANLTCRCWQICSLQPTFAKSALPSSTA